MNKTKPTQELIDLAGGTLEQAGRKQVIISGRIMQFDEITNEARGEINLITNKRIVLLDGKVTIRVHQLEFELQMLQSIVAPMRGEISMRFLAWLRPSIKSIRYENAGVQERSQLESVQN